jgi:hypothetical protein
MNRGTLKVLLMAGAAIALAGCSDSTSPAALISTAQIAADVAATSGDAVATTVENLTANEVSAALPAPGFSLFGSPAGSPPNVTITRSKICYDASNAVVANCTPLASVAKIAFHWTLDGSRSQGSFTGAVHRVHDLTVTRNFTANVETSRTHDGVGSSNDTTTFTGTAVTRTHIESASDSVQGVVFQLPRNTNPFPTAGKIIRNSSLHVTYQSATRSETRDVTKRTEVDFPADAQGNVTLKIDAQVCNLNLVTHSVTNCH